MKKGVRALSLGFHSNIFSPWQASLDDSMSAPAPAAPPPGGGRVEGPLPRGGRKVHGGLQIRAHHVQDREVPQHGAHRPLVNGKDPGAADQNTHIFPIYGTMCCSKSSPQKKAQWFCRENHWPPKTYELKLLLVAPQP